MKELDVAASEVPDVTSTSGKEAAISTEAADFPTSLKPSAWDNRFAVVATWVSFWMFGMSDGTIGALLPSIQEEYNITYTIVSLIFFSQVIGYGVLGMTSSYLLSKIGRRWGVLAGCGMFTLGMSILVARPPQFGGFICGYICLGFAAGFFESILNAFLGSFRESNAILGALHGFYGLGCAVAPLSATQWISRGLPWYRWYTVLLGLAGAVTLMNAIAFRKHTIAYCEAEERLASDRHNAANANSPRPTIEVDTSELESNKSNHTAEGRPKESALRSAIMNKFCIIGAVYMFCYLALEISTGGFVLTFLTKERHATEVVAGYVNTGFWLGLTLGRFVLTPVAGWLGAWLACQLFTALGLCCILTFWLAPNYIGSSIGVALVGFFIGPSFPLIIQIATDYLPPHLHVAGIGLIASLGSVGGAVFPLIVGIVSTSRGPKAIPPVLVALFAALLAIWMFLPGPRLIMPWMQKYKTAHKLIFSG